MKRLAGLALSMVLLLFLASCIHSGVRPEIDSVTPAQAVIGETPLIRLDGRNFQLQNHNPVDRNNANALVVTVCGAPLTNVRFVDAQLTLLPLVPIGEVRGRIAGSLTGTLSPDSQPGLSDVVIKTPHITEPAVLRDAFECLEPEPEPEPGPAPIISVSPASATLLTGETAEFTATVVNLDDAAVTWSVNGGSLADANANPVSFTAPATAGTFTLTAMSAVEESLTASATITVETRPIVTVALTPGDTTLYPDEEVTFQATVTGTDDTAVTWSGEYLTVAGNQATFTAPDDELGDFEVTATSVADPTRFATATVGVVQFPLLVNPSAANLQPGASLTIRSWVDEVQNSNVNWSATGGSLNVDANGHDAVWTAPLLAGDYVVTVTSPDYPGLTATVELRVESL